MQRLTADDLRSISLLNFAERGFPAGGTPDPLDREIGRAVVWLEWATGQIEDSFVDGTNNAVMWEQMTQLLTEERVIHRSDDYQSELHSNINEIAVSGYSEKRIPHTERTPFHHITYNEELDLLLWMLMTDDKRSWWINQFTMPQIPVEVVNYFDSSMDEANYPSGYNPYAPGNAYGAFL